VNAAQRVAVTVVWVEVVAQNLLLLGRAQAQPDNGGGFGKGTTEAFKGLKSSRWINPDRIFNS